MHNINYIFFVDNVAPPLKLSPTYLAMTNWREYRTYVWGRERALPKEVHVRRYESQARIWVMRNEVVSVVTLLSYHRKIRNLCPLNLIGKLQCAPWLGVGVDSQTAAIPTRRNDSSTSNYWFVIMDRSETTLESADFFSISSLLTSQTKCSSFVLCTRIEKKALIVQIHCFENSWCYKELLNQGMEEARFLLVDG